MSLPKDSKISQKIESLREQIRHHNWRYYVLNQPEISDLEYDHLIKRLIEIEETYPEETRKMSIALQTGMVYRWTHEVKKGDFVIVPLKFNDTIKIGKFIEDKPFRDLSLHEDYVHVRKVNCLKDVKHDSRL